MGGQYTVYVRTHRGLVELNVAFECVPNVGFRSEVHDSYSTCSPAAKHDSEALGYETICVWQILAFALRFGQDIKGETYKCLTNCALSWSTRIYYEG